MNLVREIALGLAAAVTSSSGTVAFAQQEVDPDHFDGPGGADPEGAYDTSREAGQGQCNSREEGANVRQASSRP